MPSPSYSRFIESMNIGYEQWHDGIGYDVEALPELVENERSLVEEALLRHLADHPDWRDVEALQALGTPEALEAVRAALNHWDPKVRAAAIRESLSAGQEGSAAIDESIEDSLVRSLQQAHSLSEFSPALDLAERHPTARVKKALLECARLGDADIRVNAAAMLMFVCGLAKEPFDWEQRPFLLQFRTDKTAELRVCWEELRKRAGL